MLPLQGPLAGIIGEKTKHNPGELKGLTQSLSLAPGETRSFEFQLYGGSKGYTQLKKLGLNLEHAVDFGYFGFLGKWALKAMDTLHRITGNYGWAIVILTCFLQVLLLPLSIKSYTSMAAMKKLQPKIQELQKRYKGKPKELNQETMNLYKSSGTNPFGGCLPMILQIPVFWAFFTMLRNSFELRGAPWIFWIHDLSQKDPYYVLPILMGLGMLIQQKMSGQSGGVGGDPMQAKIMMFLPVIFTLMFLKFPSGLVLYWFTNSLLSMSIQWGCAKRYAKT
jgi:YidC/Oxa1 family membrane protein insertase